MIETFVNLLLVVGASSLIGIGPYLALTPEILRHPALLPALLPNLGFALLAIASVPFLYSNRSVVEAFWLAVFVSAGLAALSLRLRGRGALAAIGQAVASMRSGWPFAAACLSAPLLLMLPAMKEGSSSVPWRIGVDQAGHLQVAQFLLEGGTFRQAAADIVAETGTSDEWQAIVNNLRAVRFSAYVNSDFMNKMHRVGYSAVVAALAAVMGVDHVYRIGFLPLIVVHSLTVSLIYWFLRHVGRLPRLAATAAAVAVGINCNLQNVLFEGMYGQFFATPLIFLVFLLALALRNGNDTALRHLARVDHRRELLTLTLFLAFVWAAIVTDFAEAILLVVPTLSLAFVLDRLFGCRTSLPAGRVLGAAFVAGTVLVLPQSAGWFSTLPFRLGYLATSGFWQPHWAWPIEILGFKDIYASGRGYGLIERASGEFGILTTGSLAVAWLGGAFLLKCKAVDRATWLSPLVYCAAVLFKNLFLDTGTNYQYMKAYTLWLPSLSLLLVLSLWNLQRLRSVGRAKALVITIAASAMIGTIGLRYQYTLYREAAVIGPAQYQVRAADMHCGFEQYVFLTMPVDSHQAAVMRYMMVPLMRFNWLNEGNVRKNFTRHADKKVALFFNKPLSPALTTVIDRRHDRVIFENSVFLFFDTGLRLQEVISENGVTLRYDLIEAICSP
jgi:hypothetical protein